MMNADGPAPKVLLADKGYDADFIREDMETRARIVGHVRRARERCMPLVSPYVSAEPDGVLPMADGEFQQGASWYLDPSITAYTKSH